MVWCSYSTFRHEQPHRVLSHRPSKCNPPLTLTFSPPSNSFPRRELSVLRSYSRIPSRPVEETMTADFVLEDQTWRSSGCDCTRLERSFGGIFSEWRQRKIVQKYFQIEAMRVYILLSTRPSRMPMRRCLRRINKRMHLRITVLIMFITGEIVQPSINSSSKYNLTCAKKYNWVRNDLALFSPP